MNPGNLFLSPNDLIQQVEGMEERLRRRRQLGAIGSAGLSVLLLGVVQQVIRELLSKEPPAASLPWVVLLGLLAGLLLILIWARYLIRESRQPFRYTFSVEPFIAISSATRQHAEWLRHDLARRLADRINRLSILAERDEEPEHGGRGAASLPHIRIGGEYGCRKGADGALMIEITPRVQIGHASGPATLGRTVIRRVSASVGGDDTVHIDSDEPGEVIPATDGSDDLIDEVPVEKYTEIVEAVYFSVASEVYRQIRDDVEAKIELLPTRRLRATAFLHEAEDYSRSNTMDAYEGGRDLFERARRAYDPATGPLPVSAWRRRLARAARQIGRMIRSGRLLAAWLLPALGRRELLTARAETGYANTLVWRNILASMSGVRATVGPFVALDVSQEAVRRVESVPPDVPGRRDVVFDAYVTRALTLFDADDVVAAQEALKAASDERPVDADQDPRYALVAGLVEPRLVHKARLLQRAVERDPDFVIARFVLANTWDDLWRARGHFERTVAEKVCEKYEDVIDLNPGSTGALGRLGYIKWLLASSGDKAKDSRYRSEARDAFERGREYKEIRRDADVADLEHGLTRAAAEGGRFEEAYHHYINTVASRLSKHIPQDEDHLFAWSGKAMLKRYDRYLERVQQEAGRAQKAWRGETRLIDSVCAFVGNDCGEAYLADSIRSGDDRSLRQAKELFEEADALNRKFVLPAYNLARLHYRRFELSSDESALDHARQRLQQVLDTEPDWTAAKLLKFEVDRERARALAEDPHATESAQDGLRRTSTGPAAADADRRSQVQAGIEKQQERQRILTEGLEGIKSLLPPGLLDGSASPLRRRKRRNGPLAAARKMNLKERDRTVGRLVRRLNELSVGDLDDLQVAALRDWGALKATSKQVNELRVAERVLAHVQLRYLPADPSLLIARMDACATLAAHSTDADRKDLETWAMDCRDKVKDLVGWALRLDPAHRGLLSWADSFETQGLITPDEFVRILETAWQAADVSQTTLIWVGDSLERLGRVSSSRNAYRHAIKLDSQGNGDPMAALRLAEILERPGAEILAHRHEEFEKAEELYRRALRQADAPAVKAQAAFRLHERLAARRDSTGATKLRHKLVHTSSDAALELAQLMVATQPAEAVAVCDELLAFKGLRKDLVGRATLQVGYARFGIGARDAALEAFQAARELDPAIAPEAALRVGELTETSNPIESEGAYRAARGSGEALREDRIVEAATLRLARLLHGQGRTEETVALYRAAADAGDFEAAWELAILTVQNRLSPIPPWDGLLDDLRSRDSLTATALGEALWQSGDTETAEAVLVHAAGLDQRWSPRATLLLGELLAALGRPREGEAYLLTAAQSSDLSIAPVAAARLGWHHFRFDQEQAERALSHVLHHEDHSTGLLDRAREGPRRISGKRTVELERLYRELIYRGSRPLLEFGHALLNGDQLNWAEQIYLRLASSGDAWAPDGALALGNLLARTDRLDEARTWYEQAANSKDPTVVPHAQLQLGALLLKVDGDQARSALGGALEGAVRSPDFADAVAHSQPGEEPHSPTAKELYRDLIQQGSRRLLEFGQALLADGEHEWAERVYLYVASRRDLWAPDGALALGNMLSHLGRVDEAREWYEKAASSGDPTIVPAASQELAALNVSPPMAS